VISAFTPALRSMRCQEAKGYRYIKNGVTIVVSILKRVSSGGMIGRAAIVLAALWSGVGLVAAIGLLFGAGKDASRWTEIDLPALLLIGLPVAALSHLLRFLRWDVLVRRIVPTLPFLASLRIQLAGFGLTATPARLGDLTRFYLLQQQSGTPIARSLPLALVERATDGVGLALLALVAGLLLAPTHVAGTSMLAMSNYWPVLVVLVALVAIGVMRIPGTLAIVRRVMDRFLARLRAWLNVVVARRGEGVARELGVGGWLMFDPRAVVTALLVSLTGRLCDALVLFVAAASFGYSISPVMAVFVLGTAGVVGGLSMLPGGMGAVEASMIGLLVAFGAPAPVAVAATVVTRALIFWLWVALGLTIFVVGNFKVGNVTVPTRPGR
jgi:glycosyltransferase 2 family protein